MAPCSWARWFASCVGIDFRSHLDPNLALSWAYLGNFSALLLAPGVPSQFEVLFASIFHRFQTTLEPQKLSSRVSENQILQISHLLS